MGIGVCSGPPSPQKALGPESTGGLSLCGHPCFQLGYVTSPRCQGQPALGPAAQHRQGLACSSALGDNTSATETEVTWSGSSGQQARHSTVVGMTPGLGWRRQEESPACTLPQVHDQRQGQTTPHTPASCAAGRGDCRPQRGWLADWPGVHTPKTPGTRVPRGSSPKTQQLSLALQGRGFRSLETVIHAPPG